VRRDQVDQLRDRVRAAPVDKRADQPAKQPNLLDRGEVVLAHRVQELDHSGIVAVIARLGAGREPELDQVT
jgi:hypothetical protein